MKKSVVVAFLISACCFVAFAQDPRLKQTTGQFKQTIQNPTLSAEELKAPASVQQQLLASRKMIAEKKLTFTVGLTSVSKLSLKQLAGEKQLSASEEAQFGQSIQSHIKVMNSRLQTNIVIQSVGEGASTFGSATQRRFDLRTTGNCTPVKDQNPYGTCWAFGAVSAYESNYRITNTQTIDASEQQVINCSGAGDENGGLALNVLKWMVDNKRNLNNEETTPYRGPKTTCGTSAGLPYYAQSYGVVDPSGDPSRIASVTAIKQALVRYGAISASVQVTDAFQNYTGSVFNEFASNPNSPATNHAITIIGWDDNKMAWIIKNSWGTDWGINCDYGTSRGYMYIGYNSNNIGRRAAWVLTKPLGATDAAKGIASVSRIKNSMENWWIDKNGTVQAAYWYEGAAWWGRYQIGSVGGASVNGGITAVSRAPTTMEVWWIGSNGSVQAAFWYEGSAWKTYELAPAGSAATTSSITAVSRAKGTMEVWWVGANGSVQGAFWYEGQQWKRYEIAPANSAAQTGGITAMSRATGTMELWWIGTNGSVQGAFWYEGNPWKRYELSPANTASLRGSITSASRIPNNLEVYWVGSNGSLKAAYWYEGGKWTPYELSPAGTVSLNSGIDAISRQKNTMELWWVGSNNSIQGKYWYEGGNWTGYELAPAGSASNISGISGVSRASGAMELWWVGANGSIQSNFWYENSTWKRYELAPKR